MESGKQIRKRHEEEIESLQSACEHKNITKWQPYYYMPGHSMGEVKVCKFCGKIMEKSWPEPVLVIEDQAHLDSIKADK